MTILDVQNIEKHFGETKVLQDISFTLEEGKELRMMDDVTVTLTDPNSGEQVYQRQLRLTNREIT